jgi:hypothetical protein
MQYSGNLADMRERFQNLRGVQPRGVLGTIENPIRPGTQQPFQPQQPGTQQPGTQQPVIGGLGPLPNNLGPMRQPLQQAAPTQPVTAMKKGGVVRGGRAEIKGTRPAKLS